MDRLKTEKKLLPSDPTVNGRLARTIASYWAAAGYPGTINFTLKQMNNFPPISYTLSSDMVNGLPRKVYDKIKKGQE